MHPQKGSWRATAVCDDGRMGRAMSTNVFGLAGQVSGLAAAEELTLAVRANARVASEHGDDGDWAQRAWERLGCWRRGVRRLSRSLSRSNAL